MLRRITACMVIALLSSMTFADDFDAVKAKLATAMAADSRTAQEKARDANRLPIETLEFFGLRDDMKVVELIPGGGWYTQLLAPVLAENGEFTVALGTGRVEEALLGKPGFQKVEVTGKDAKFSRPEGARFYDLEMTGLGVKKADMVLTFRNYHNFAAAGRAAMNNAAFNALKRGGIYGVVDHTARHMESASAENRRRMDPVLAIKEIQSAGFELVDFSDLHYRPDDELRYEVGRKTVTGNTDRWTLKFRKP
ncbi:MAG: class I SAM-dependent methyltransferase [Pseudomonadales bacterium]